jgi:thioesterase domain-containing protein
MSYARESSTSTGNKVERTSAVFILPGVDDNLRLWTPLQEAFGSKIIDYLDWTELLTASLADLVAHVLTQIEDLSPAGEIRLVGYSLGGSLGYAVAKALQTAGRPVSCLVLLDASAEVAPPPKSLGRRLRERFKQLLTLASRDGIASLAAKLLMLQPAMPLLRYIARRRDTRLPFNFDTYLHRKIAIQVMRPLYWSWWRSTVESGSSLMTPTILFRSEDHGPFESEDLGWKSLCKNLTVIRVAALHDTMLDPGTARVIRAQLESIFETE